MERQSAPLFARIQQENSEKYGKLEAILPLVAQGDVRRGLKVFRSTQAACINCHALGYLGGHIGPDLSKIGKIRSDRDLLESILFPSASFVRSFEPMIIVTTEGKLFSGIVTNETRDEITLQLDAQKDGENCR